MVSDAFYCHVHNFYAGSELTVHCTVHVMKLQNILLSTIKYWLSLWALNQEEPIYMPSRAAIFLWVDAPTLDTRGQTQAMSRKKKNCLD